MIASEYVEYRQSLAIIGLSSLIGSISLIFFSSGRPLLHCLPALSALMLVSLVTSFYFMYSPNTIIASTLLIFSISAVINSYNKINISKAQYFCLTSIPAILIIAYMLRSNHVIPTQLLLVLSVIQAVYFSASYWIIKSENIVSRG